MKKPFQEIKIEDVEDDDILLVWVDWDWKPRIVSSRLDGSKRIFEDLDNKMTGFGFHSRYITKYVFVEKWPDDDED